MEKVKKHLETFSPYDFEGTLQNTVTKLQILISEYHEYDEIRLDYGTPGYDGDTLYSLTGYRPETPEEAKQREQRENQLKKDDLVFKKQQYEKLKKELGM